MPSSPIILVVDDSPTQLEQLRALLHEDGFEVLTASDGEEALKVVAESSPAAVVTDLLMPGIDGLELVERLKVESPSLPVVLTTSQGSEDIAAQALQRGAASYVPKRELSTDLAETVRRVLAVVQAEQQKRVIAKYTVKNTVELSLENDDMLVPSVIARLERPVIELGLFDEGEWMQVAMALDEALLNAMIHGNLEVSSDLRHQDDGKPFVDMITKRKQEQPYCGRRVNVQLQASLNEARFIIRDEGPGFDSSKLLDPTDPENLEKAGGRGLLLINSFMDEVHHNEKGNEIVMIKRKAEATAGEM